MVTTISNVPQGKQQLGQCSVPHCASAKQEAKRRAKCESSRCSRQKGKADLEYFKRRINELQRDNQYLRSYIAHHRLSRPYESTVQYPRTNNTTRNECEDEQALFKNGLDITDDDFWDAEGGAEYLYTTDSHNNI